MAKLPSDEDRWRLASTLKQAGATEDDEAVRAAVARLPPISRLAFEIAEIYSEGAGGVISGPLMYARVGNEVEKKLLEGLPQEPSAVDDTEEAPVDSKSDD